MNINNKKNYEIYERKIVNKREVKRNKNVNLICRGTNLYIFQNYLDSTLEYG